MPTKQASPTYKQMSQLFGVKVDTAYRICSMRKYQAKKRGGSRGKKLNDTHVQFLLEKVESRPDITLNELKEQLSLKGVQLLVSTIARCLEGKLITMKKLEQIPINRNCEELKASRREHATWLMSKHEMGARFCYVDECGFGLYTSRTRGRAVRGLPAKKITGNQRTPHITMLCAISPNVGLIHHTIIVGGARQSHFDQFIEELFGCDFG